MNTPPEKTDVNMLLASLKRGEVEAFDNIFAAYYEKLCIYLLSYTDDKDKIEDVVQETFLTLWAKREQLDIRTSLKSYLYRSAHNKLMDTFREQNKNRSLLSEYYHTSLIRAIDLDEDYKAQQMENLKNCMDKLPVRCRKVFTANKITGKKYQQVANELNLSLKTVEGHITRAYKLLKECMGT